MHEEPTAADAPEEVESDAEADLAAAAEDAPPEAVGARSICKGKVMWIDEQNELLGLEIEKGEARKVNLKSFSDLWPVLPQTGDQITFPPPPGSSRFIIPTLSSLGSPSLMRALHFLEAMHDSYEEEGAQILMRVDMYCAPLMDHLLGTKLTGTQSEKLGRPGL